jgi:hypothetical protein
MSLAGHGLFCPWAGQGWAYHGMDCPCVGLAVICTGHGWSLKRMGWPLAELATSKSMDCAVYGPVCSWCKPAMDFRGHMLGWPWSGLAKASAGHDLG